MSKLMSSASKKKKQLQSGESRQLSTPTATINSHKKRLSFDKASLEDGELSTSSESEVDSTAETVLTRNPEHQVLDKLESEMTLAPSKTFRVTLPEKLLTLADLNRLKGRHASFQNAQKISLLPLVCLQFSDPSSLINYKKEKRSLAPFIFCKFCARSKVLTPTCSTCRRNSTTAAEVYKLLKNLHFPFGQLCQKPTGTVLVIRCHNNIGLETALAYERSKKGITEAFFTSHVYLTMKEASQADECIASLKTEVTWDIKLLTPLSKRKSNSKNEFATPSKRPKTTSQIVPKLSLSTKPAMQAPVESKSNKSLPLSQALEALEGPPSPPKRSSSNSASKCQSSSPRSSIRKLQPTQATSSSSEASSPRIKKKGKGEYRPRREKSIKPCVIEVERLDLSRKRFRITYPKIETRNSSTLTTTDFVKLDKMESTMTRLQNECEQAEEKNKALADDLKAKSEENEELKAKLTTLTSQNALLVKDKDTKALWLKDLNAKLNRYENGGCTSSCQHNVKKEKMAEAKVDAHCQQCKVHLNKVIETRTEVNKKKKEVSDMMLTLNSTTARVADLQASKENLASQLQKVNQELAATQLTVKEQRQIMEEGVKKVAPSFVLEPRQENLAALFKKWDTAHKEDLELADSTPDADMKAIVSSVIAAQRYQECTEELLDQLKCQLISAEDRVSNEFQQNQQLQATIQRLSEEKLQLDKEKSDLEATVQKFKSAKEVDKANDVSKQSEETTKNLHKTIEMLRKDNEGYKNVLKSAMASFSAAINKAMDDSEDQETTDEHSNLAQDSINGHPNQPQNETEACYASICHEINSLKRKLTPDEQESLDEYLNNYRTFLQDSRVDLGDELTDEVINTAYESVEKAEQYLPYYPQVCKDHPRLKGLVGKKAFYLEYQRIPKSDA